MKNIQVAAIDFRGKTLFEARNILEDFLQETNNRIHLTSVQVIPMQRHSTIGEMQHSALDGVLVVLCED